MMEETELINQKEFNNIEGIETVNVKIFLIREKVNKSSSHEFAKPVFKDSEYGIEILIKDRLFDEPHHYYSTITVDELQENQTIFTSMRRKLLGKEIVSLEDYIFNEVISAIQESKETYLQIDEQTSNDSSFRKIEAYKEANS